MTRLYQKLLTFSLLGLLLLANIKVSGQAFDFTAGNLIYAENFDGIGAEGTVLPTGWEAFDKDDNSPLTALLVTNGSSNSGNIYNVGIESSAERAFGTLASGSTQPTFGASFTNNSGAILGDLAFDFFLEQWRSGSSDEVDEVVTFEYSLNATSIDDATATWVSVEALNLNEILVDSAAATAVDGTLAANRQNITHSITNIAFIEGATLYIRWSDENDSGGDGIYAIDDLSITATESTSPIVATDLSGFNGAFGILEAGNSSDASSFSVSGSNLSADILVSVPAPFEISDTENGTYATTLTITNNSGSASEDVWVRFSPTVENGAFFEEDIILTSTGAPDENVSVSGTEGLLIFSEDFSECDDLNSFSSFSVIGNDQEWECDSDGFEGSAVRMNGFNRGPVENEDWLISTPILVNNYQFVAYSFFTKKVFSGPDIEVLLSNDYDGTSSPTTATWLPAAGAIATNGDWLNSGINSLDVSSFSDSVYLAFKYSSTSEVSASWFVDNVQITGNLRAEEPALTVVAPAIGFDFGTVDAGSPSFSQSFTVSGENLDEEVTVTAPAGYAVSLLADTSFADFINLSIASNNSLAEVTVYVRFAPAASVTGQVVGDVSIESSGLTELVAVAGVASEPLATSTKDRLAGVSAYPNPVSATLNIAIADNNNVFSYNVMSLNGAILLEGKGQLSKAINIADIENGLYLLTIKQGDKSYTTRFVKE